MYRKIIFTIIPLLVFAMLTVGNSSRAEAQAGGTYRTPSYSYRTPTYSYRTPTYSYRTPTYSYRTPNYRYRTPNYGYRTPAYGYPTTITPSFGGPFRYPITPSYPFYAPQVTPFGN
ncbi:MAG: hypothetical protein VYA84_15275 [Planctomycetota bacterium]|nr:hypothetical protein [Planctomycetota bacterium]